MPLSPKMRQLLLDRLSTADAQRISLTGADLRCATVEDAERLVVRFTAWLDAFSDLSKVSELEEDRTALIELHAIFQALVIDQKVAIHATRHLGVPWEKTTSIAAEEN